MATLQTAIRMVPEQLRTLAFGSISGTYAGLGTAFNDSVRIMHIVNFTDVLLTFSIDGVNDYWVVAPNSYLILDFTANATTQGGSATVAAGTRVYVKGSPTVNAVYLTVWYATT